MHTQSHFICISIVYTIYIHMYRLVHCALFLFFKIVGKKLFFTIHILPTTLDRYDAITHPMNFSGSWKRARLLVAAAWILSVFFNLPILFLYDLKKTEDFGMQCWIPLGEWEPEWVQVYFTLVAITLFFVPTIIISACYIIIVITIWKKGKAMQTTSGQSESTHSL